MDYLSWLACELRALRADELKFLNSIYLHVYYVRTTLHSISTKLGVGMGVRW